MIYTVLSTRSYLCVYLPRIESEASTDSIRKTQIESDMVMQYLYSVTESIIFGSSPQVWWVAKF